MNLILHTVKQEKQRVEYMLAKYQSELSALPKGVISEKKVGEKTYYYLKYRDGKKVISQYVSKKEIENVRALIVAEHAKCNFAVSRQSVKILYKPAYTLVLFAFLTNCIFARKM